MYKRPTSAESDEDILQLQKDFEQRKNTIQLAAKIATRKAIQSPPDPNQLERRQVAIDKSACTLSLLGEIVERTKNVGLKERKISKAGFPSAIRRVVTETDATVVAPELKAAVRSQPNLDADDQLIQEQVHAENVAKIDAMTEEEICDEIKALREKYNPKTLEFLKNRKRRKERLPQLPQLPNIITDNDAEQSKDSEIKIEDFNLKSFENTGLEDVLNSYSKCSWINFDVVEVDKLKWLQNVHEEFKQTHNTAKKVFEARFDLNGNLLPFHLEMNESNRILYHHGEEPERPGYSIKELLHLTRSNVIQQRLFSLSCLEKCLQNYSVGLFDDILELPLEQIFFVVRFALDENTSKLQIEYSLKALKNCFYNDVDELCLDNVYFIGMELEQPIYEYSFKTEKEYEEIDDQQLAEIDLIKCLIQTNIFTRFTYVMTTSAANDVVSVRNCLRIILRIAQDSDWSRNKLLNHPYLVDVIFENFLPKNLSGFHDVQPEQFPPIVESLKLIRILVLKSPENVRFVQLLNRHRVIDIINDFIFIDIESNLYALLVQIECLGIWMAFLKQGLHVDKFAEIYNIMLRILHFHIHNTNLDDPKLLTLQKHCVVCLNMLTTAHKNHKFNVDRSFFTNLLQLAIEKWTNQFIRIDSVKTINLQLLIAIINALTNLHLHSASQFIYNIMSSSTFSFVLAEFLKSSNLLKKSAAKVHKTGATFSNLETICMDVESYLIPALYDFGYCQMFMKSLTRFLLNCNRKELVDSFLNRSEIKAYLQNFLRKKSLSLTTNWFTEILEKHILFNILMLRSKNCHDFDETYLLAVKFLSFGNIKDPSMIQELFEKIIFSKSKSKILMDFVLENLHEIESFRQLYLNKNEALVSDWPYKPLLCFLDPNYDEITNKDLVDGKLDIFQHYLQWISNFDRSLDNSSLLPSPVNRFCKFSLVFLSPSDVFLNANINKEITNTLKFIVNKHLEMLDFDEEIIGFGNFENLYKKLLEQYQSCSYSDVTFANVVLLPLEQKQNSKWKLVFWSEYETVAHLIQISENQLFVKLERFTKPTETKKSVLSMYAKNMKSNTLEIRAPLLTQILKSHLRR